jgi:hypothetical protein
MSDRMPPEETKPGTSVVMVSSSGQLHSDPAVCALLSECPFLVDRVDLSEGSYYITGQVALLLQKAALSNSEMDRVLAHLNKMATGDDESQNLLVVGILEILADTEESIARTRLKLGGGSARLLFERVLIGWVVRP